MKRFGAIFSILVMVLSSLLLAACGSGPVRRVSEPAASIQQLTVHADGRWSVALRINNFSSVPMRFDTVALALAVGSEAAGSVQGSPGFTIGPESADVTTLTLSPGAAARIVVADALAARRALAYTLKSLQQRHPELPHVGGRDVVVYCNCPNEVSAALAARVLLARGARRALPLTGGLDAWVASGRPTSVH